METIVILFFSLFTACEKDVHDHHHYHELMTTVVLTYTDDEGHCQYLSNQTCYTLSKQGGQYVKTKIKTWESLHT